jgi:prepilin signal peptidase PulO-like enzyme (type II secretory pathway)
MSVGILFVILFGVALGSFLNVIVIRFPDKPITGRSFCPKCKKKLRAIDLIPLISYILIRGRCVNCRKRISIQYLLVELVVGIVAVTVFMSYLNGVVGLVGSLVNFFIIYILIGLFLIDLRTFLLPDLYIVMLTGLVVLNMIIVSSSIALAFVGALIGAGFLLILWIITARRGIGLGDVKLMIPLGFLFGPVNTVLLLLGSFILGGSVGLVLLASKKATLKTAVPFGPFLAGVAILFVLFPDIPAYLLEFIV